MWTNLLNRWNNCCIAAVSDSYSKYEKGTAWSSFDSRPSGDRVDTIACDMDVDEDEAGVYNIYGEEAIGDWLKITSEFNVPQSDFVAGGELFKVIFRVLSYYSHM
jgi:hypothetical protein